MGLRGSFIWRRAGSTRLLLGSVLLSTLIAASLSAALAGFAATSLPQAVSGELKQSPRTTIAIEGAFNAAQARADGPAVVAAVRRAFGTMPFALHEALWSDPIELPAPRGAKTIPLVQAAAPDQIRAYVALVSGTWPGPPRPGAPVGAAVPATAASAQHLVPGELLTLRDRLTGARVRFRLTGTYRPLDPASPYWGLDLIATSGISVQPGFTTYGPLVVAPGAFGPGGLAIGGASWLVLPDTTRIGAAQLNPLAARISTLQAYLSRSSALGGLQVSTGLPASLSGVATKLVVARSLLTIGALELLLLAGTVLTLTARTLASQREEESAVLSARGAGRWQLARLAVAEALMVTVAAAAIGALAGNRLAGLLASAGSLRSIGLRAGGIPLAVWWTVGAVLLLCTAIMLWPALRPGTPGAVRVRKGRRAAVAAAVRAGADGGLILLALLAGWQLRRYSALSQSGGLGIDPVLAVAPAIALAAATVLPLRLLPLLARATDRLAARTRRLGTAMASWEISRRAVRQSAPVLLVVLAVGTCTLALAQHQTWHQSVMDQAAFAAGADARVEVPVPVPFGREAVIAHARGVTAAMPVTTSLVVPSGGQVLAVDASSAPATVLLRADQSAQPAAALWRRVVPARLPRTVTLPGRPDRLEITASLDPGAGRDLRPVSVSASVQDAAGVVFSVPAGLLPDDGHGHRLIAQLSRTRQAIYPLRLLSVSVSYTLPPVPSRRRAPAVAARSATLTVRGLAVAAGSHGAFTPVSGSGRTLADWRPVVSAPSLADPSAVGTAPDLISVQGSAASVSIAFHPGDGQIAEFGVLYPYVPASGLVTLTAPVPFTVIPGIATQAFLHGSHLAVGDLLQISAGQQVITVKIVAVVADFPTISGTVGGLIVDQGAAQDIMAALSAPPLTVTQWWLATRSGSQPPGLPAGAIVTDRARLLSALEADPLSAIPQQAVQSIAVAAALLAILGFSVSVAASVRERRSQSALLAALGVDGAAQARLLCLEALALSLPAAVTGLLLGTVLAHLLVPAVTLTATAVAPVPSVLVEVPLATAALLALTITAVPVLAAAATAVRRPDAAAQLRVAESI
ncbi:MAG TPA: FtsX-like permease family protein [Streptosporangiaceae bacterium]|nr:FtsX-like permease family protein [Streptosporangiaceae bacterium]